VAWPNFIEALIPARPRTSIGEERLPLAGKAL